MPVVLVLAVFGTGAVTGPQLLDYVTLTQNFAGADASAGFLPVSWSLAIEEWFYILFGFVLIAMRPGGGVSPWSGSASS